MSLNYSRRRTPYFSRNGSQLVAEDSFGSAQEAFERLAAAPVSELAARYEEARGDALAALGRIEEARAAYQRALDQGADPAWRELVELKRDGLGG